MKICPHDPSAAHDHDCSNCGFCQALEEERFAGSASVSFSAPVRVFTSGATRDTLEGKPQYEGFLSPIVLQRFAEYMTKHRHLSDGTLRDSDNWQKGIEKQVYMDSLLRHVVDLWLHHDGFGERAREGLADALCGILFNTQGYLFEHLK